MQTVKRNFLLIMSMLICCVISAQTKVHYSEPLKKALEGKSLEYLEGLRDRHEREGNLGLRDDINEILATRPQTVRLKKLAEGRRWIEFNEGDMLVHIGDQWLAVHRGEAGPALLETPVAVTSEKPEQAPEGEDPASGRWVWLPDFQAHAWETFTKGKIKESAGFGEEITQEVTQPSDKIEVVGGQEVLVSDIQEGAVPVAPAIPAAPPLAPGIPAAPPLAPAFPGAPGAVAVQPAAQELSEEQKNQSDKLFVEALTKLAKLSDLLLQDYRAAIKQELDVLSKQDGFYKKAALQNVSGKNDFVKELVSEEVFNAVYNNDIGTATVQGMIAQKTAALQLRFKACLFGGFEQVQNEVEAIVVKVVTLLHAEREQLAQASDALVVQAVQQAAVTYPSPEKLSLQSYVAGVVKQLKDLQKKSVFYKKSQLAEFEREFKQFSESGAIARVDTFATYSDDLEKIVQEQIVALNNLVQPLLFAQTFSSEQQQQFASSLELIVLNFMGLARTEKTNVTNLDRAQSNALVQQVLQPAEAQNFDDMVHALRRLMVNPQFLRYKNLMASKGDVVPDLTRPGTKAIQVLQFEKLVTGANARFITTLLIKDLMFTDIEGFDEETIKSGIQSYLKDLFEDYQKGVKAKRAAATPVVQFEINAFVAQELSGVTSIRAFTQAVNTLQKKLKNDPAKDFLKSLYDLLRKKPQRLVAKPGLLDELQGVSTLTALQQFAVRWQPQKRAMLKDVLKHLDALLKKPVEQRGSLGALRQDSAQKVRDAFIKLVKQQEALLKLANILLTAKTGQEVFTRMRQVAGVSSEFKSVVTAFDRMPDNVYNVFNKEWKAAGIASLGSMGIKKELFIDKFEQYGLIIRLLQLVQIGEMPYSMLLESLRALNTGQKKTLAAGQEYPALVNNFYTTGRYQDKLGNLIKALENDDAADFEKEMVALVSKAGVGVEQQPAFKQLIKAITDKMREVAVAKVKQQLEDLNAGKKLTLPGFERVQGGAFTLQRNIAVLQEVVGTLADLLEAAPRDIRKYNHDAYKGEVAKLLGKEVAVGDPMDETGSLYQKIVTSPSVKATLFNKDVKPALNVELQQMIKAVRDYLLSIGAELQALKEQEGKGA